MSGEDRRLAEPTKDLIRRCRNNDQSAIRELVERFQGLVFGLCYRMLGQRQDAEDAAQESFVRAIRSLDGFDAARQFEPWLLAIAANRCRTALAARARRPSSTDMCETVLDRVADDRAAKHLHEELHLALQQLRPEHREAFVLFHEFEKSYLEIAEAMQCPVGTVKTWVHRARQELIAQLRSREVLHSSGAVA
jgi:RNA polymerase sigma-70 factor (ECF subfamily)